VRGGGGLRRTVKRGKSVTGALADRASFAGVNFGMHLLLARWLEADAYGVFVTCVAVLWLLAAVFSGAVIEPMMVFGSGRYRKRTRVYLWALCTAVVLIGVAFAAICALGVALLLAVSSGAAASGWVWDVGVAVVLVCVTAPAMMLLALLRHACYLQRRAWTAAAWGTAYGVVAIGGLCIANAKGVLTWELALGVMCVASALSAVGVAATLRVDADRDVRGLGGRPRQRLAAWTLRHGRYSRAAVPADMLIWVPTHGVFVLAAWLGSLESSASLRAMLTLLQPILQALSAMGPLLIPSLARRAAAGEVGLWTRRVASLLVAIGLLYGLGLALLGPALEQAFYGGKYADAVGVLWVLAALPAATAGRVAFASQLRAAERPGRVLLGSAVAACVTVALAPTLIWLPATAVTLCLAAIMVVATGAGVLPLLLANLQPRRL